MNFNIRPYRNDEFNDISNWWKCSDMSLSEGLITEDGSFILEIENVPALSLTVLKTQTPLAYLFGYIKNPAFKKVNLEDYGMMLWSHCYDYAKSQGYKKVACFAQVPQLKEKYQRFGMIKNLELTSFIKVL